MNGVLAVISMKDIARVSGVSVATVSKALSGQSDISVETRDKIRKIADDMGYMTNSAARALKTNRTYNIGVLFVDERNSGLTHEFFSSVLESIKAEAEKSGYDITFISRSVKENTSYLQHCLYRGVDGVIIANVDFDDPMVSELVCSELPVVTIDHVFNNCLSVVSDNANGAYELVKHIYSKGHKSIAFLHGELTTVTKSRLVGFYRACEEFGIKTDDRFVFECNYHDPESCAEATRKVMSYEDHPTCIMFSDDFSYIGAQGVFEEMGLTVGEDISAVGYDGIDLAMWFKPTLTTYKQDVKELGRIAAKGVIDLIERPKTTLKDRIVVEGKLREGNSVKDVSK